MTRLEIASNQFAWIKIHHVWFAARPTAGDAFRLTSHFQCRELQDVRGFVRQPKFTLTVDLTQTPAEFMGRFNETVRYEVNRAAKEGLRFEQEISPDNFRRYFDQFSQTKLRDGLDDRQLAAYWPKMHVTKVMSGPEPLAMHSYLHDTDGRRVVLLQSASLFRAETDKQKRNLIGRANRWLHYQDMLLFKEKSAAVYDFGGFAKDTQDPELAGINQFKSGFGGVLVSESNFISLPIHFLRRVKAGWPVR